MAKPKKRNEQKLSLENLTSASHGDADAMERVLENYTGYIRTLSTKSIKDESGKLCLFIDETLQHELELQLISAVIRFKPGKKKSSA